MATAREYLDSLIGAVERIKGLAPADDDLEPHLDDLQGAEERLCMIAGSLEDLLGGEEDTDCDCGWVMPGALVNMDTPQGIVRCDDCCRFEDDFDATLAVAQKVGGIAWFEDTEGFFHMVGSDTEATMHPGTNPWVTVDGKPVNWEEWRKR